MKTLVLMLVMAAAQAAPSSKIDIVSVAGCLKESAPNDWRLVNATDPAPSSANAPAQKDIPAAPPVGKNEFKDDDTRDSFNAQHSQSARVYYSYWDQAATGANEGVAARHRGSASSAMR